MRVGVDVGGTFTDLVALAEDGTIDVRKVVTTPADPTLGLFKALDALASRPIPGRISLTSGLLKSVGSSRPAETRLASGSAP